MDNLDTAKQIIATLFGLMIAYLLPGIFALATIGLLFEPIGDQLLNQSGATEPSGLSVILFLFAILAGVQLHVIRWAIYVKILGRKKALGPKTIAALGNPKRAGHYQLLLDQVLRFHQFSGAQSIVLPFFVLALVYTRRPDLTDVVCIVWIAIAGLAELFTVWSAIASWTHYVDQATALANMKLEEL